MVSSSEALERPKQRYFSVIIRIKASLLSTTVTLLGCQRIISRTILNAVFRADLWWWNVAVESERTSFMPNWLLYSFILELYTPRLQVSLFSTVAAWRDVLAEVLYSEAGNH